MYNDSPGQQICFRALKWTLDAKTCQHFIGRVSTTNEMQTQMAHHNFVELHWAAEPKIST